MLTTTSNISFLLALVGVFLFAGCASQQVPQPQDYGGDLPVFVQPESSDGAIFAAYQTSLFIEDTKAQAVGDILTVLLVEKTDASKQANTSTAKETALTNANPTVFGRPVTNGGDALLSGSIESDQLFTGEGSSSQSNSLAGTLSVTVVERYPNGNLRVAGRKRIELNQGSEFVTLTGIVRPLDIGTDNTVRSDRLAFAEITYGGSGVVNDANRMGFLSRFFNSPWALF